MKVAQFLIVVLLFLIFGALIEAPIKKNDETLIQQTGTIEGTVQLTARSKGLRSGGGLYGRSSRTPINTSSSDSVLIILSGFDNINSGSESIIYLNQKDRQFKPDLLAARLGQTVRIQNSDPLYHNVFSLTSPHKFDVGRRPQGENFDVTFDKPGIVDVFCDIHSNMHAIIYVMPENAILSLKVASGDHFAFSKIPEGDYTLTYIALGYKESNFNVRVNSGEVSSLGIVTLSL